MYYITFEDMYTLQFYSTYVYNDQDNSINDVPGDTTFYNMVYRDQNSNNVPISYQPFYDAPGAVTPLGLYVDLSSCPAGVVLNTAN